MRPDFLEQLEAVKPEEGLVLGGESFPFGVTALYVNSDGPELAQRLAHEVVGR